MVDESVEPENQEMNQRVACHLTELLARRKMSLSSLSDLAGISIVNLSVLKNGHARAIRFSTLIEICRVLECEVGELLTIEAHDTPRNAT